MEPLSGKDPRVIGEFRLRARLGSGGMGRVYLGFSPAGRAVAVKVVHPHIADDQEFLDRFRHEVEAASKVSGLYAAAVVASGVDDSPPWLATAYVPGPSLAVLVDHYPPLPEEAVWRLAAGLAEALGNVHAAGLIHRDLKPQNVLIADDGPRVIDFGIARAFEGTHLTLAGTLIGTPGYMSPEQVQGEPVGAASDIFALGCVLAYAATGKPPFGTGSDSAILYRTISAEPNLTLLSGQLRRVIQACLNKAPGRRPRLAKLADMIASAGPKAQPKLGSFWPEPVSAWIAAAQAAAAPEAGPYAGRTPTEEVSPPAPTHTIDPRPAPAPSVPAAVGRAIRLMYLGFAVTLADAILSLLTLADYNHQTQAGHPTSQLAGAMTIGVAADLVGLVGWAWLALACRRGAGWARSAGTALIAIYTICTLIVVLFTHNDPAPRFTTIAVWIIGLAAAAALWTRPAAAFFAGQPTR
jgi:hypothetical protein